MYENYESPNHGDKRKETKLIILHGTHGGQDNLDKEFEAAVSWHYNSAGDKAVSSHAIYGINRVCYPVDDEYIAWHAKQYNEISLGIELVQPHIHDIIPREILIAAAKDIAKWCDKYSIPVVWNTTNGLCEHRELDKSASDIGTIARVGFLNLINLYAIPSVQRKIELRVLPEWYLACVENNEDWTIKTLKDFIEHLKEIGADYMNPKRYGWK